MEFLGLDEETHKIYAAIAVGHLGDKNQLNAELQEKDGPSDRISTTEFAHKIV